MATIQIRNVPPPAAHGVYRMRAGAAGMSLQEYLLAEIVRNASLRTPTELVREVEERIRSEGEEGFASVSAVEAIRADRASH